MEKEKVELTYRLHAVSNTVTDKEEYYEDLLRKWKAGVDKTIDDKARGRVKRELENWEVKQVAELKAKRVEELRVRHVDKLMQTVWLDPVEVSLVGV